MNSNSLLWNDLFSVSVKEIDDQHKLLFEIINGLVKEVDASLPDKGTVSNLLNQLVRYKTDHFATEEKYFKAFNYEGADEHIREHRKFTAAFEAMAAKHGPEVISLAYDLVLFLEDWLVDHLIKMDQKYTSCFHKHGLK